MSSNITNKQQNDETNDRIYTRNIPQQPLQPYLDIKPTSTSKCNVFPILDRREANVHSFPSYNIGTTFNPGNRRAPWSGFSNKVGDESILRNQIYPLQRNNTANTYIPSSSSDLYVPLVTEDTQQQQQFPFLSASYLPPVAIEPKPKDPLLFGNHTRYQL